MASLQSLLLGKLDYVYVTATRRSRFFSHGWGEESIEQAHRLVETLERQGTEETFPDIDRLIPADADQASNVDEDIEPEDDGIEFAHASEADACSISTSSSAGSDSSPDQKMKEGHNDDDNDDDDDDDDNNESKGSYEAQTWSFVSPCADFLPKESQTARVLVVSPPRTVQARGVLILVAGTGEVSFWRRKKFIAKPLAAKGFVSIILESVFYGSRAPVTQKRYFWRTVGDYLLHMPVTVVEVAKLAKYAKQTYPGLPIGLVGSSLGGSMAAGALPSVMREFQSLDKESPQEQRGRLEETPITLCTFLPPSRTASILSSAIAYFIDFRALQRDGAGLRTIKEVRERILHLCESHQLGRYFSLLPESEYKRTAFTCFRGRHDNYVRPNEVTLTHGIIEPLVSSARLVDVSGGHVWNIMRTGKVVPPAVEEAFSRSCADYPNPMKTIPVFHETGSDLTDENENCNVTNRDCPGPLCQV
ncbi:Protein ABHD18 [Hondaea fermentalgiana]|uniref:Protein ABHD18 n=1 Tax=Hondaea fermentalgiana TaxID=2315210 RepID=A0A2R5GUH3_9STRA|nr:Protein ABHD18 [Hondaea fermentalgiana]|eukprot:GBG34215.1 Protein ABHD18 [Hondaea fermentalgiana]